MIYSMDICSEEKINLSMNTTPAGHGKHTHDTLIGVIKRKVSYGFVEGLIYAVVGQSVAGRTITWLKGEFDASDAKYNWQFIEVFANEIRVANSPTKRILTDDKK